MSPRCISRTSRPPSTAGVRCEPVSAKGAHAYPESVGDGALDHFVPLQVAILTISDTRGLEEDRSGDLIEQYLAEAGHSLKHRAVVKDEVPAIRAEAEAWSGPGGADVIVATGGTGVTARDVTPEAVEPLFYKQLPGFGELFRALSLEEIGAAAMQSRATAGVIDGTILFALPGSPAACRLAMERLVLPQIDSRTKPCSFATLLPRIRSASD